MAGFTGTVLTVKGRALQSKAQIGTKLEFTKVKLGSGEITPGQSLEALTDLIHPELTLAIQNMDVIGDGTSRIRAIVSNENIQTGFSVREIGLYANDPQEGEILYSVSNAGNLADFIPAGGGAVVVEQVLDLITVIGNTQNVVAKIDNSLVLATKKDIESHSHKGGSDGTQIQAKNIINALLPGLTTTNVQETLAAMLLRGKHIGRNMLVAGPKDSNDNPIALYSDLTNGNITLKTGTKLTFANGFDDNGMPRDIPYNLLADVTKTLDAADANTVPYKYSSDMCNGGIAISGGDGSSLPASNAFDNNNSTTWAASQNAANQNGVAWIGYDFGVSRAIRKIMMNQNLNAASSITSVKIQYSSNKTVWNDAVIVSNIVQGINVINVPAVGSYRYWRILANANLATGNGWYVNEIEMYEALQTHYLFANYMDGAVNLVSSKNAPRRGKFDATAIYYSNNLCVGGAVISGGDLYSKENAFDGDTSLAWSSGQNAANQSGVAWIGYNFGTSRHIRKITILQGIESHYQNISSVKIQRSTNGIDWVDVGTYALTANLNALLLPSTAASQYWRCLANANSAGTGYPWDVYEITMHEIYTDINHYDPETGVSKHYDGTTWSDVIRIYLGSADVDSSGKIVAVYPKSYNLARLRVHDAESADEPVALGQFKITMLPDAMIIEIPTDAKPIIIQVFSGNTEATKASNQAVKQFPYIFPERAVCVLAGNRGTDNNPDVLSATILDKASYQIKRSNTGNSLAMYYYMIAIGC